jgi:hypothetical protein
MITKSTSDLFYASTAIFSDCEDYRYALTRQWASDNSRRAVFVMLNPSTADERDNDPTIARCIGFAQRERCGSLTVVNLFALRATDPSVLRVHPDPVGPENDEMIRASCTTGSPLVICAWGVMGAWQNRDVTVSAMLLLAGVPLVRLGPTTSGGHPRHPLYLPNAATLHPWPAIDPPGGNNHA